jgi:hypothetical protein
MTHEDLHELCENIFKKTNEFSNKNSNDNIKFNVIVNRQEKNSETIKYTLSLESDVFDKTILSVAVNFVSKNFYINKYEKTLYNDTLEENYFSEFTKLINIFLNSIFKEVRLGILDTYVKENFKKFNDLGKVHHKIVQMTRNDKLTSIIKNINN